MVPNELVDGGDPPRVVRVTAADGYGKGSIITPEAVVLDFELAGLASRAIAFAIDFTVQVLALFAFLAFAGLLAAGSEVVAIVVMLVGLIVIVLGYSVLFETFKGGRTLGRMVVKTRVVTVEGAPVRFRHALIRSLLGIIDLLGSVGAVAVVSSLLTRRGQRLGDLVAGTMVIREPGHVGPTGAFYFWPAAYLAEWSRTVDTRALGNDTYQLVRDFLSNQELADEPRAVVADELALLVSERLPHAARPAAVPSMDYLTAIAAATQDAAAFPPPAPRSSPVQNMLRSPVQPPPPGAYRPSPVQPPPPMQRAAYQPPPPVGQQPAPPQPRPAAPQPQPQPAHPAPPAAPNEGGFSAPG